MLDLCTSFIFLTPLLAIKIAADCKTGGGGGGGGGAQQLPFERSVESDLHRESWMLWQTQGRLVSSGLTGGEVWGPLLLSGGGPGNVLLLHVVEQALGVGHRPLERWMGRKDNSEHRER